MGQGRKPVARGSAPKTSCAKIQCRQSWVRWGWESPLGNVNWSVLTLPFLWPLFKSARGKYERSTEAMADAMKDGVKRLKKIDVDRYAKPIRKRWKSWT